VPLFVACWLGAHSAADALMLSIDLKKSRLSKKHQNLQKIIGIDVGQLRKEGGY